MTKRVKNISILILTLLLSVAVILTVTLTNRVKTVDAMFLITTENVEIETEKGSKDYVTKRVIAH